MTQPPGGTVTNHRIPDGFRYDQPEARATHLGDLFSSMVPVVHHHSFGARALTSPDRSCELRRGRELIGAW